MLRYKNIGDKTPDINNLAANASQKIINCVQVIFQKILELIILKQKNKKMGLGGVVKYFSVDFNLIDNKDILDIHKYLMKKA